MVFKFDCPSSGSKKSSEKNQGPLLQTLVLFFNAVFRDLMAGHIPKPELVGGEKRTEA
jgi:hypothetical protein